MSILYLKLKIYFQVFKKINFFPSLFLISLILSFLSNLLLFNVIITDSIEQDDYNKITIPDFISNDIYQFNYPFYFNNFSNPIVDFLSNHSVDSENDVGDHISFLTVFIKSSYNIPDDSLSELTGITIISENNQDFLKNKYSYTDSNNLGFLLFPYQVSTYDFSQINSIHVNLIGKLENTTILLNNFDPIFVLKEFEIGIPNVNHFNSNNFYSNLNKAPRLLMTMTQFLSLIKNNNSYLVEYFVLENQLRIEIPLSTLNTFNNEKIEQLVQTQNFKIVNLIGTTFIQSSYITKSFIVKNNLFLKNNQLSNFGKMYVEYFQLIIFFTLSISFFFLKDLQSSPFNSKKIHELKFFFEKNGIITSQFKLTNSLFDYIIISLAGFISTSIFLTLTILLVNRFNNDFFYYIIFFGFAIPLFFYFMAKTTNKQKKNSIEISNPKKVIKVAKMSFYFVILLILNIINENRENLPFVREYIFMSPINELTYIIMTFFLSFVLLLIILQKSNSFAENILLFGYPLSKLFLSKVSIKKYLISIFRFISQIHNSTKREIILLILFFSVIFFSQLTQENSITERKIKIGADLEVSENILNLNESKIRQENNWTNNQINVIPFIQFGDSSVSLSLYLQGSSNAINSQHIQILMIDFDNIGEFLSFAFPQLKNLNTSFSNLGNCIVNNELVIKSGLLLNQEKKVTISNIFAENSISRQKGVQCESKIDLLKIPKLEKIFGKYNLFVLMDLKTYYNDILSQNSVFTAFMSIKSGFLISGTDLLINNELKEKYSNTNLKVKEKIFLNQEMNDSLEFVLNSESVICFSIIVILLFLIWRNSFVENSNDFKIIYFSSLKNINFKEVKLISLFIFLMYSNLLFLIGYFLSASITVVFFALLHLTNYHKLPISNSVIGIIMQEFLLTFFVILNFFLLFIIYFNKNKLQSTYETD